MKYLFFFIGSLALSLLVFLVVTFSFEAGKTQELQLEKPIAIVLKTTAGQPMNFWRVVEQGIYEASREFGVAVSISGPEFESQIDRQLNIMERVISENPPLIILAASDYNLFAEPVAEANEKGIPVITLDSGVNSVYPVSFIATDNIEAGIKSGGEMARLVPPDARSSIAIVSHIRETATAIEREAGVRLALEGYPVAGTWYSDNDAENAYRITLDLLENPAIGGIVALNEISTLGVARAIDETGSANRIPVVGFDNAPEELAYLQKGVLKATVVQRPYNMGYIAVRTAVDYLKGNKVDSIIDTGSVLITRGNMFQREYQELLFPVND